MQTSTEFYEKLRAANPEDPDFKALDQGVERTKARHRLVGRFLLPQSSLLDLGCGTGLLEKHLGEDGNVPKRVVGVDLSDAGKELFLARCKDAHIDEAEFIVKPESKPFEAMEFGHRHFDVAVAVGLVGTPGYHSAHRIVQLIAWMCGVSKRGLVTIPRQYEGMLGHPDQAHFDVDDFMLVLNSRVQGTQLVLHSEREMSISW